jgi:hypothetical protein
MHIIKPSFYTRLTSFPVWLDLAHAINDHGMLYVDPVCICAYVFEFLTSDVVLGIKYHHFAPTTVNQSFLSLLMTVCKFNSVNCSI